MMRSSARQLCAWAALNIVSALKAIHERLIGIVVVVVAVVVCTNKTRHGRIVPHFVSLR